MENTSNLYQQPDRYTRLVTFFHAVLFVLGFSLVFIIGWGSAATIIGQAFGMYKGLLGRIGGVIILLFGLSTLGLLKMPMLYYRDTRHFWTPGRGGGVVSSLMMGVFFAAGWTPCIGTTLGAILTMSFNQPNQAGQAMFLTSGYALGLGIPFLIIGLGMDRASAAVRRFRKHMRAFQIGNGMLLIMVGLLMIFNQIFYISIWAQRNGYFVDLPFGKAAEPTYLIAFLAGLISFLSPCVFPLIPAYIGYLGGRVIQQTRLPAAR